MTPWAALGALPALAAAVATSAQTLPPPPPPTPQEQLEAALAGAEPATVVEAESDRERRLTVGVQLNGSGPYPFVVDTAADRTVVSRDLASRLALPPSPIARLHDIAGITAVQTVIIDMLEVGGGVTRGIRSPMLAATAMGAHGILGIDALADRRVVIDFAASRLSILPVERRRTTARQPGEIVVTARRRHGQLIMTNAEVDGEKVDVIVDSGAEGSVGNPALFRRLARGRARPAAEPVTLVGVTGRTVAGQLLPVPTIRLANMTLGPLTLAFADLHSFRRFGLARRPALLLGMDVLRAFDRVALDFGRKRIAFLPARAARPAGR